MLFTSNLEELIFNRHLIHQSDELVILSGYLGPNPVRRLANLPIKSTVIYGMYASDGISEKLHNSLLQVENNVDKVTILYSNTTIHSKCYIWKKEGKIIHALIGSANFSTNGLSIPYKEMLAETTYDTLYELEKYLDVVIKNSISCTTAEIKLKNRFNGVTSSKTASQSINPKICRMVLYDPRKNEVQPANGLNWGQSAGNVKPNDSSIPIRADYIENYPELFPPKQIDPIKNDKQGRKQRHNDAIELIWDDGTVMDGLLEGSYTKNNTIYPKQIASFPKKEDLGIYIRNRLGVKLGEKVTMEDLKRYGRDNVDISLISEGVYYIDFSVE
ncbi:restriction endonuclease PLD domain-containing protein [Terrisporobacter petrolearius]|uniref:restriction endonuclease PLD domain-containing protein n=1 Tax=Terrisporobacter petrolearius TaxID=1460447 RepID=UPI003B00736D